MAKGLTIFSKNGMIVKEALKMRRFFALRKFLVCLIFFFVSPFTLFLGGYLILVFNSYPAKILGTSTTGENYPVLLSSLDFGENTSEEKLMASTILAEDSSLIMIKNYLKRFGSPLLPYAENIVEASRRYNISPYLIVAIAQQESNLGKTSPENCYNAWGWGIHSRGTTCFDNWPQAIETVAKGIAHNYCAKGYCDDPCLMMKKYTPKSNGSWCFGVNQFLNELRTGDF